jgi:hypothetical protein
LVSSGHAVASGEGCNVAGREGGAGIVTSVVTLILLNQRLSWHLRWPIAALTLGLVDLVRCWVVVFRRKLTVIDVDVGKTASPEEKPDPHGVRVESLFDQEILSTLAAHSVVE